MATSSSPPPRRRVSAADRGPRWRGRGSRGSGRRCWRGGRRRRLRAEGGGDGGAERGRGPRRSRRWSSRRRGLRAGGARSHLVQTRAGGGRAAVGHRRAVGVGRTAVEQQVGAGGLVGAEGLGLGLRSRLRGRLDPRGVDQLDGQAVAVAEGREVVAGRPGDWGETRARAWPSRALNSRLLPALGGPTSTTRGCPSGRSRPRSRSASAATSAADRGQAPGQRGAAERVDVGLVDEVEVGFQVGQDVEQAVAESVDRPGQAAGQLLAGRRRAAPGSARRSRRAPPRRGSGRSGPRGRRGA